MGKIALVEKFFSVQGEGRNAGRSAYFIRLAGCNLRCDFSGEGEEPAYCDTPWMETREKLEVHEIADWLRGEHRGRANRQLRRTFTEPDERPMVVLTGGEPTMSPSFDKLVETCRGLEFYVAIETNGTIYRDSFEDIHWVSCSPKNMVPQGNPFHGGPIQRWNPPEIHHEVITHMASHPGEYRYVISGPKDGIPPYFEAERHYVSPAIRSDGTGEMWKEGFPGFVEGAMDRCIEIVQQDPRWRISTQQHKLWGVR